MSEIAKRHNEPLPISKRYEVARYLLETGNARIAAEMAGMNVDTLRDWKKRDWWPQLLEEVKQEKRSELAGRLGAITETALSIMQDRLENGEYILNGKTGEIIRKPVGLRDANQAANNLLTQQARIEELNSKRTTVDESINDVLKQLAGEFAKYAKKKKDVIDVEFKEIDDAVHETRPENG